MDKTFLLVALSCIVILKTSASTGDNSRYSTEITAGKNATHIGRISGDTLVVVAGTTYYFTVDTPEDQGLVSTNTDVAGILLQVSAVIRLKNSSDVTMSDVTYYNDEMGNEPATLRAVK